MNRAPPPTYDAHFDLRRVGSAPLADSRWRTAARWLASEPLIHFFVLSALLWAVHAQLGAHSHFSRITITKAFTAQLAEHYRQQYGAPPSGSQLDALVDAAIAEEMAYRQAIKLGLDQGDEIVRRRLIQKYEFLQQDLATPRDPTLAEARDFYARYPQRYVLPERLTFTQVYFSPDRRGDAGARDAAAALAAALNVRGVTRAANEGDPYPGPSDFVDVTPVEIGRVFGHDGLSKDIVTLAVGHWSAPLRSGYGWHTVYVSDRDAGRRAEFEEVRDHVIQDFREAERNRRNSEAIAAMRNQFEVIRE